MALNTAELETASGNLIASRCFELFWPRETGGDVGILVKAADLDGSIRERVLTLASAGGQSTRTKGSKPLRLYLPFLDQWEWRRRSEVLRSVRLIRVDDTIRCVPATPGAALCDRAAMLLALDPAWRNAPRENDDLYFPIWQKVSLALQCALRTWIPELYFRDVAQYEDRNNAYAFLVYQASRICRGRPHTEFTYDVVEPHTLPSTWRMTGQALKQALEQAEKRLRDSGHPELARRYAPIWYEDVLRAVQQRPQSFRNLLAQEAQLIDALIDMGSSHEMAFVKPFSRKACSALRHIGGMDMRELALKALSEATKVLKQNAFTTLDPANREE